MLVHSLAASFSSNDLTWLYLGCMTVVASLFPVRLPYREAKGHSVTITTSDIFILSSIPLYSAEVAVTLSAIDSFLGSSDLIRKKRVYRVLFNVCQFSFVTFLVGKLFYSLHGDTSPVDPRDVENIGFLLLSLAVCALIYFVLNSGAMALAISLVTKQSLHRIWKENFLWISPSHLAGASGAAIVFVYFKETPIFAIAVATPIALIIYRAHRLNLDRIKQLEKHDSQEAANRELEAFSYSVSHDLRAPLRAIDGFSHVLLEDYADNLDEEGKRLLNIIRRNSQKMGQLIDDLLAFSRLGYQRVEPSEINMEELAREVFEELQFGGIERTIELTIAPVPPAHADLAMIRQLFVNLLSNALKFTATRNNAVITMGCRPEGNENLYYIKDNGVGFNM